MSPKVRGCGRLSPWCLHTVRAVAQFGSAPDWGSGGRRFKSCQPDKMLGPLFKLAPSRTCFEICTIMRSGSSALHYPLGRRNGGISALCVALIRPCGDLSALCEALFLGKPCIGWQETAVFKQQYSGCHGISASHNADRPPQHPDNASHKRDDELQTPNEQTSTGKSHRTRRFVPRSHYCLR